MSNTTLGDRLRSLRERAGLKPAELGERAGLKSPAHVSMIERGERGENLSAAVAISLARVLGCSVEYLIEGIDPNDIADVARAEVSP